MSDFFGDDFTADLKDFFLNELSDEVSKYVNAVDEDSLHIFCKEISEKSSVWTIDAISNEYVYFAKWLENTIAVFCENPDLDFFKLSMQQVEKYIQTLLTHKQDSEHLAQTFKTQLVNNKTTSYLRFKIESRSYILLAQYIIEVTGKQTITPLPQSVRKICGMLSHRGDAIPVFNLSEKNTGSNFYCIICTLNDNTFALKVDSVDTLIALSDKELQSKEKTDALLAATYVSHFVIHEDKNMMVFDLPSLLAS